MRAFLGVLLILAGAALLVAWVVLFWYPGAPIEEPANLGSTPNPSVVPWTYDAEEPRSDRWKWALLLYGLPAAGVGLAALGAVTLAGSSRPRHVIAK